jgi:hypothetical protein
MGWAPPKVTDRLRDETVKREAHAFLGLTTDDGSQWWRDWNRDLEAFMPGLRLCWCPDPAPVDAVALGARPGRYGLLFPSVMGGPVSVSSFSGPNDEFVQPGAWVFDMLRANDWQNPLVRADRERALEAAERAKAKREQDERDEMTQEILERYLAVSRAQVSMSRDVPWSQNSAGRRGARQ